MGKWSRQIYYSSVFLLLAQTMKECNDIAELRLMGDWVALGTFDEVVNVNTESKNFIGHFKMTIIG